MSRQLLTDCRRLLSVRGEGNSTQLAATIVARLDSLPDTERHRFFDRLASDFSPDPARVLASAQAYAAQPDAVHQVALTREAEPLRQELFRRLNRAPGGTAALVRLRRALLERLPRQKSLAAVESDLLHLLSSWFNPGFLEMRRVDWDSPAQLLEQIIRHEAVHEIDGWDDLRRRLQPDRRCFAFFHPQLPHEPLIFVEVALVPEMSGAIAPLIDKRATPLAPEHFKVAVFYSISNCQPGLRGVSMGNFLIKRVAEQLKRELPQLKTFCTRGAARAHGPGPRHPAGGLRRRLRGADARHAPGFTVRRGAPCAVAPGGALPGGAVAAAARRPGGSIPSGQRRAARAPERAGQPVGQGPEAIRRPDGELPI